MIAYFLPSVFFRRREVEVYPDNYVGKPKVGVELNKKSEISLHKVWPNDKTSHTPIKVSVIIFVFTFQLKLLISLY